jgi:hypothetical protein
VERRRAIASEGRPASLYASLGAYGYVAVFVTTVLASAALGAALSILQAPSSSSPPEPESPVAMTRTGSIDRAPEPSVIEPTSVTPAKPVNTDASEAALAGCVSLWDASAHMSKQEWTKACRRSIGEQPAATPGRTSGKPAPSRF